MPNNRKFYQVLGCAPGASADEIKKKYRKLSAKWHPDKNPNNAEEATKRFQEISGAYAVLSDPEKRPIYDRFGEEGLKQAERGGGRPSPGMHPFAQMFGGMGGMGGMGHRAPQKAQPIIYNLQCSMHDLYVGATKQIKLPYKASCEPCEGTGNTSKRVATCGSCKGQGHQMHHRQIGPGMVQQIRQICSKCRGSGEIVDPKDSCETCHGRKWQQAQRDITFTVYPGMEWSNKMVLEGKGDELRDQLTGDVVIALVPDGTDATTIANEPKYELKNGDIIYELSISLLSALTGLKYRLRHPGSGKYLFIDHPEVIHSGQVYMVRGQGMARLDRRTIEQQIPLDRIVPQYGDLIVQFNIRFPEKVTKPQKQILRKLFQEGSSDSQTPPQTSGESPPMDLSGPNGQEGDLKVTLQPTGRGHRFDVGEDEDEFGDDGMPEGVQCAQQ